MNPPSTGSEAELKVISEDSSQNLTQKIAEIDWEKKTTNYIKEFLSQNKLNEAFCEFAGHGVRKAKKVEYVAFFESYQKTND